MPAEVTVLITTFNRENYLIQTLNSILNQTYPNWKILLVDDGSSDNTFSIVEKTLPKGLPITIIRNPTNLGQSRSLNIGLSQVDTPYLVQLDSDDLFFPFTLEVLIKAAKKQPKNVAVIYGNYLKTFLDDQGTIIKSVLKKGRSYHDRYQFLLAKKTLRPRFYRTSALKAIGGWPTNDSYGGRYAEDLRILLRLIERYQFHWIDQVLYIYHKHTDNLTNQTDTYVRALDWILFDTLKRWGNKYTPVFKSKPRGWNTFEKLIPKKQKKLRNSLQN